MTLVLTAMSKQKDIHVHAMLSSLVCCLVLFVILTLNALPTHLIFAGLKEQEQVLIIAVCISLLTVLSCHIPSNH